MGGFAKKTGKHNREPSEEKIVLDVLRATHGRVKIRGNVNRWSVIKLSKRSLHAPRAVYTRATRAAVIHSDVSLVRKGVNLAEPMAESRAQILPLVPFARKT